MRTTLTPFLLLGILGMTLAGCSSTPHSDSPEQGAGTLAQGAQSAVAEKYAAITAARAPFYQFGPAQHARPDAILKKGDLVKYVRKESGFSQVQLDMGLVGYVSNDFLADAPAPTPPAPPEPVFINATELMGTLPQEDQPVDLPSFRLGNSSEPGTAEKPAEKSPSPRIRFR